MEEWQQTPTICPPTSHGRYFLIPSSINSKMVSFQDAGGEDVGTREGGGQWKSKRVAINTPSEGREVFNLSPSFTWSFSSCFSYLQRQTKQRIVGRGNGRTNILHKGVNTKKFGFVADFFTTIINTRWYVIISIFILSYLISWIFFGAIWLLVAVLDEDRNGTCIEGVDDFPSALLFSIETQVTIGYGNKYVTNHCLVGLLVLSLQCVLGLIMDAILLGLLFTKITRPRNRRKTIVFSEYAVMCVENGVRYLEFRIGDLRKSQIAECHVRLVLYWYRNLGGDTYSFEQHDLECGYENGTDRILLLTPVTIRHRIDQSSPLWNVSPQSVGEEELEVVVVLEGVVEATGLTLQALWSYTAEEIVVGERLKSIVRRRKGLWVVDFTKFNDVTLTH